MRVGFVAMGMVAVGCGAAAAQSFSCGNASTPVEKAICQSKDLGAADVAMAAKYKHVLGAVPVEVQAEVRSDQRAWLRGVALHCKGAAPHDCILAEYKAQTTALDQRVVKMGGMTFVQRSIELMSKDDKDDPWAKDQQLEENPGYGTLDASWPQALSSDPEWVAWNAAVLAETQRMAGDERDAPAHAWNKDWADGAETTVTAKVVLMTPQLVTTSIGQEGMGHGAAHPNESSEQFHWMLKERRRLAVGDVFKAGSAWEAVVSARCRASLKQQVGDDYQSYAGDFKKTLHEVVAEPGNWEIDAKGLSIDFPEYSVAPRAQPVEPVKVPWGALRSYLAVGFVVPR